MQLVTLRRGVPEGGARHAVAAAVLPASADAPGEVAPRGGFQRKRRERTRRARCRAVDREATGPLHGRGGKG